MSDQFYTVASCPETLETICPNCHSRHCYTGTNHPRRSLDGSQMIITGIYEKAPDGRVIFQDEAEALMATEQWTDPDDQDE